MPARVGLRSASTQVRCNHRPEMVYPAPNELVGDYNAALCQQVFDVAQAQGEPEVEPDRLLDDLGWETVAAVATGRPQEPQPPGRRDNAVVP
jgi:hypothetical protein